MATLPKQRQNSSSSGQAAAPAPAPLSGVHTHTHALSASTAGAAPVAVAAPSMASFASMSSGVVAASSSEHLFAREHALRSVDPSLSVPTHATRAVTASQAPSFLAVGPTMHAGIVAPAPGTAKMAVPGAPHVYRAQSLGGTEPRRLMMPVMGTPKPKTQVKLDKPALLPPPPFFVAPTCVRVPVGLGELRACVEGALRSSNVDFEYNEAKWKAKCYVYKTSGACMFVARMYTQVGEHGSETYLVELQRRKGCHAIFRGTFESVLAALEGRGGALSDPAVAEARTRAKAAMKLTNAGEPVQDFGSMPPPPPSVMDASWDVSSRTSVSSDDLSQPTSAADMQAIAEAFSSLTHMLASEFDDIATPAAQSIASLAASARARSVVGHLAMDAMRATAAPPAAATPAAPSAPGQSLPAPPPISTAVRQASSMSVTSTASTPRGTSTAGASLAVEGRRVLDLLRTLLLRATDGMLSIEGRTACVLALGSFAVDGNCAEVIIGYNAANVLVDAVLQTPASAPTAAFRRESLHTIHALLSTSDRRARVARTGFAPRVSMLRQPRFAGVDKAFDVWARNIDEALATVPGVAVPVTPAPPS